MEADNIADYRPRFLSGDQKPAHDAVKTWVRGFWKAMALAPETWHALVEDERTQIIIEPFIGFFDLGELEPHDIPANIGDLLDEHAAVSSDARCNTPADLVSAGSRPQGVLPCAAIRICQMTKENRLVC